MNKDKEEIPIVWGVDEKYILQAFVVMHSVLTHSNNFYCFFVITTEDIEKQIEEYTVLLKNKYDNFLVSIKKCDKKIFEKVKIHNQHLSKACYFRLLIPEVLDNYDKCIYLDCDVLVNGDIEELFSIEMGDNYLAGVKDCHIIEDTPRREIHQKLLGIPSMDNYINSGVLLINLKKIREDCLVKKFVEQMDKENWFEDQDVLNCCCYPNIKILPLKYNLFHFYTGEKICHLYHLNYDNQEFEFQEPFIIHMGGEWKPWNSRKVKCADIWWNLAELFKNTDYYKKYQAHSLQGDVMDCMLKKLNDNKEKMFVIWGYAQNGKTLCNILLAAGYKNIVAIADNDKGKWGEKYRSIPVMGIEKIIDDYDDVYWIISNQIFYEEIRAQIMGSGISEENITRYINIYNIYKNIMYLLSLDEKYYEMEVERIAQLEYTEEMPDDTERKKYILNVINAPCVFQKEYEYLDKKYYFDYWYNAKLKKSLVK